MSHNPQDLHDEYTVRCQKVALVKQNYKSLWQEALPVSSTAQIAYKKKNEEYNSVESYAGRIMLKREHGKSLFLTIQDRTGQLQAYLKQEQIGQDAFDKVLSLFDLGDYVWFEGNLFLTKTGELTVRISSIALLSKCLHPLPDKFHGFTDTESRYRQRYLDLMVNNDVKKRFIYRSKVISHIRNYLEEKEFLEVETPMLHPIPGGASARPFITHHNALNTDFYLRIAPELYLKKLVVGGFERVYEINRNFRNEGVSTRHNPEFTMVEFYMAHQNYEFAMQMVEDLLRSIVKTIHNRLEIVYNGNNIDFSKPFARLTATQALVNSGKVVESDLDYSQIDKTLKNYGIDPAEDLSYEQKIFLLFEEIAEKSLIQPTFLIDFPIKISPLAKQKNSTPELAARFELYICGMEISNGYNELNDPFDQASRFEAQAKAFSEGNVEAMHFDQSFIDALEYGMPPTAGVGIGIDRLVMLVTDTPTIKDVILFPALRPKDHE